MNLGYCLQRLSGDIRGPLYEFSPFPNKRFVKEMEDVGKPGQICTENGHFENEILFVFLINEAGLEIAQAAIIIPIRNV